MYNAPYGQINLIIKINITEIHKIAWFDLNHYEYTNMMHQTKISWLKLKIAGFYHLYPFKFVQCEIYCINTKYIALTPKSWETKEKFKNVGNLPPGLCYCTQAQVLLIVHRCVFKDQCTCTNFICMDLCILISHDTCELVNGCVHMHTHVHRQIHTLIHV